MPIGVIDLGKVGTGLVTNLVEDGYDVYGYDIDLDACERGRELGATVPDKAEAVAAQADVIFLSLPHPDASRAAVEAIVTESRTGTAIFDTSTLSPTTAVELAEQAAAADMQYFDAPITGGEVGAKAGELTVMIGGDPALIQDRIDVLSTVASDVYHIGQVGDGQFVKLVHNHVGQTTLLIFVEGLLMAAEWGVDPATLYRTLRYWTSIYDDKLDGFFANEFEADYEDHFAVGLDADEIYRNRFNLDVAHKDLVELTSLADELDTYLPLGHFVEQIHREGVNAGWGDRPHPDLLQFYAGMFNVSVESRPETRDKSEGQIL